MKKYEKTKIKKVREAIFQALCYVHDDEEFNLEEIKKFIGGKSLQQHIYEDYYKVELKGFTIYFYAQKGDTEVYVEVVPIIGKNPLNEFFTIWLTVYQFEKLLNELTK